MLKVVAETAAGLFQLGFACARYFVDSNGVFPKIEERARDKCEFAVAVPVEPARKAMSIVAER